MYRTILVSNGKYKKTLHRCLTRKTAYVNYRLIKKENESVFFPKKYISTKELQPVVFKIYLVKDIEEGDKRRLVRDDFGKLYEESPIFDLWTVIDSSEYFEEETFWVYGYNNKLDRKSIMDIMKLLLNGLNTPKMTKQAIVVHNKLVLYNENKFDMVLCKCKKDAQRLHHALKKLVSKLPTKFNILFMGTASKASISIMYDLIHERTKWKIQKIRRTTTKP